MGFFKKLSDLLELIFGPFPEPEEHLKYWNECFAWGRAHGFGDMTAKTVSDRVWLDFLPTYGGITYMFGHGYDSEPGLLVVLKLTGTYSDERLKLVEAKSDEIRSWLQKGERLHTESQGANATRLFGIAFDGRDFRKQSDRDAQFEWFWDRLTRLGATVDPVVSAFPHLRRSNLR